MKKYNGFILFPILALLLMGACSQESPEEPVSASQPIRFAYYIKDGDKVTQLSRATAADINAAGISLYSIYHTASYSATGSYAASSRLFWNTPVDAEGNPEDGFLRCWLNTPGLYYTFWAHTQNPAGLTDGITGDASSTAKSFPVCRVLQSDDPRKQVDVLVSDINKDITANYMAPIVGLYFKHLLSRIKVRFYNSHATQLNNCRATITYAANKVVKGADTNNWGITPSGSTDAPGVTLQTSRGYHSGTYPIHDDTFALPATCNSVDNAFQAGDLILVPQNIAAGALMVTLSYTPEGTTDVQEASVDLPGVTLKSGSAYTYNINIIVENTALKIADVTLSSWEGQNSQVVDWTDY